MKTIFISSFHGLISRNILATDFLNELHKKTNLKIVILCPISKKDFFEKEFSRHNIEILPIDTKSNIFESFLTYISLAGLDTKTLFIKRRTELGGSGKFSTFFLSTFLGKQIIRALSNLATPREPFEGLINKYSPNLIFSTDIQNGTDIRLLNAAKDKKIPVVGMVRSWDNLTAKGLLRTLPNKVLVNNEILREEAVRLHRVNPKQIEIIGIPHYDRYLMEKRAEKIDYFNKIGADISKKIILFIPTGDRYLEANTVDRDILNLLENNLLPDYQIVVRFPPGDHVRELEDRLSDSRVIFDRPHVKFESIKMTELSAEDDVHLADTLFYSSLVVAGPSTMCIDSAVFDKPIVLYSFDGLENKPYFKSIRRYYDYDHFKPVISSGGVKLALSKEDLIEAIKLYLDNPNLDKENRKKLVKLECFKIDGKSTQRLTEVILKMIQK